MLCKRRHPDCDAQHLWLLNRQEHDPSPARDTKWWVSRVLMNPYHMVKCKRKRIHQFSLEKPRIWDFLNGQYKVKQWFHWEPHEMMASAHFLFPGWGCGFPVLAIYLHKLKHRWNYPNTRPIQTHLRGKARRPANSPGDSNMQPIWGVTGPKTKKVGNNERNRQGVLSQES